MGIAVMVRYPPGHHRHAVEPDWHIWGESVFEPDDPYLDERCL